MPEHDVTPEGRAGLTLTLVRHEDVRDVLPLADHLAQAVTWGI